MTTRTLRYATAACRLGLVLAAVSDTGVAAILLGDDRARLVAELARMLPDDRLVADEAGLAETLATVAAFVDAPHAAFPLPLDVSGSAVERAVWDALRTIPVGETRSYGAIAKALPVAATAQEVGAACAANRVAVAIPCHRVVKADGGISGYRWGVHRKRRLLNWEAVA